MHALIVCRNLEAGTPEGQQIHGFQMYRNELKETCDFTFDLTQAMTLKEVEEAIANHKADMVVVMLSWKESIESTTDVMKRIYEKEPRPTIVFLDYTAQTSSQFFHLLPYVDRYVKRQVLRDRSLYQQPLEKLNVITDFLAKKMNYDVSGWNSWMTMPDPKLDYKLIDSWNLGVTPTYRKLVRLTRHAQFAWKLRPYAINRRIGLIKVDGKVDWYHRYRQHSLDVMATLESKYRCTGIGRVSARYYTLEMLLSKIVVSPFGWGEVCFRDYQAVATGALLIKPSMSHLVTSPDIYIDNETYVPIKWDFSDLTEKCEYYLSTPAEAMRIIRNGQEALHGYFEKNGFVEDVRRCLLA